MSNEKRRILTPDEKKKLRKDWSKCYICETGFEGYEDKEIEYDHIYAYAEGYSQDLSNFAPVHASDQGDKLDCHSAKGKKSPIEFKEELRIKKLLATVTELKHICPKAKPISFLMNKQKMTASINNEEVKLYQQTLQGKDFYYFFHEISKDYIESDDEIQLRPVDARITGLVFHLKQCPQLLPSLGRLDTTDKKIKVFDGQHKAIAQMIGNPVRKLSFLIFVDPDVNLLRNTCLEAHTKFVQQRYQPSHIDRKLRDLFAAKIEEFQSGDPLKPYSESNILSGEPSAKKKKYLEAWIVDGLKDETKMASDLIARVTKEQRLKPFLYSSLKRFVDKFARLDPIEYPTGHPQEYRGSELSNLTFILEAIRKETLEGKWNPGAPDSEEHKLARQYYYDHTVRVWLDILENSIHHGLSMRAGKDLLRPICYRDKFSDEEKARINSIVKKMFTHGLWFNPASRDILSSSYDQRIRDLFKDKGLDYIYCSKV